MPHMLLSFSFRRRLAASGREIADEALGLKRPGLGVLEMPERRARAARGYGKVGEAGNPSAKGGSSGLCAVPRGS
jgi:hypothetical protein